MPKRNTLIQRPPDPTNQPLLHALADACAEGATLQRVTRPAGFRLPTVSFPLLRTQAEFDTGELPAALAQPREDLRWAEHWIFLFPLWHGTMPALLKELLENIFGLDSPWNTTRGGSQNDFGRAFGPRRGDHGVCQC